MNSKYFICNCFNKQTKGDIREQLKIYIRRNPSSVGNGVGLGRFGAVCHEGVEARMICCVA
jgi:hypothetical protein